MLEPDVRQDIESRLQTSLFTHQIEAINILLSQEFKARLGVYHRTGSGKTVTALAALYAYGVAQVLIIAPPSTHDSWQHMAEIFDLDITCISVHKFRQRTFKVPETHALIVDEMHELARPTGVGWKKMHKVEMQLTQPIIVMSATPQYNNIERAYCMGKLTDSKTLPNTYIGFIVTYCEYKMSPFSATPEATGFKDFEDEKAFLLSLPHITYLPDNREVVYQEHNFDIQLDPLFTQYGYVDETDSLITSQMEYRHTETRKAYLEPNGVARQWIIDVLKQLINAADGKVLVFSNSKIVAEALARSLNALLYTGDLAARDKREALEEFLDPQGQKVLVGTSALATGTDGMDKVAHTLIIAVDTDDDTKRKQLEGRILERGVISSDQPKYFHRINVNVENGR